MERIVPSSVCTTAASVADCGMLLGLLHGEERKVWGYGSYRGQAAATREAAPQAHDPQANQVQEVCRWVTEKEERQWDESKNERRSSSAMRTLQPVGEIVGIKDIVAAVLYLTEASFITGEVLHVDGGAHAGRW
jgi:NAD(P)-dependent dehydrogenase (short-subunit alcohol dehydrogenase family)